MQNDRQQLFIILLIVFTGFIGTSIAYPIFPPLFLHAVPGSIIPDTWDTNSRSIFLGLALAAYPLGQFIGSPIIGGFSDRYGRKKLLISSLVGSALGYFISAASLQFNWLGMLLISRFVTGVMEGNFAIVRAMATDLESISKYKSFGKINSVVGIGYVVGPLIGGFFSDKSVVSWFSFGLPFFIAALLTGIAVILAMIKLSEKTHKLPDVNVSMWQQFNLLKRFRLLFSRNVTLKNLLIISSIFTLSVDIFYEFGAVYLTGLWDMTPAWIAIYNIALSLMLAVGGGWLPHYLSRYFSIAPVIAGSTLITAIIFGLMVIFPAKFLVFLLFGLVGLTIAVCTTNVTVEISNAASKFIQGETMGAQISLRTLGDAVICLVGGFVIISSVITPIAISCVVGLMAFFMYIIKFRAALQAK